MTPAEIRHSLDRTLRYYHLESLTPVHQLKALLAMIEYERLPNGAAIMSGWLPECEMLCGDILAAHPRNESVWAIMVELKRSHYVQARELGERLQ